MSAPKQRRRYPQWLSGADRRKYGAITTWENAEGKTISLHRAGMTAREGLSEMCEVALSLDPSFRLVSYCTPDTICTDLVGGRIDSLNAPRANVLGATYSKPKPQPLPEVKALGLIGRRELLHPRLALRVRDSRQ